MFAMINKKNEITSIWVAGECIQSSYNMNYPAHNLRKMSGMFCVDTIYFVTYLLATSYLLQITLYTGIK
jgi:hypothetical protein